jgi:hypothetical protein
MKQVLKAMNGSLRTAIRAGYVVVILLLAAFGWRSWQQLQTLRNVPVALPNFWFYVAETQGQPLVQANGTWISQTAGAPQDRLQTSNIECSKARMQCVESAAVVTVMERSFLEAVARFHDIESWGDLEIITRPLVIDKCRVQTLRLMIADKQVFASTALAPDAVADLCKTAVQQFKLDDGNKLIQKRS